MTDDADDAPEGYALKLPFWIDTDAYTERDQKMFVAGFEFCQITHHMEYEDGPMERPVHRENESRIRMAAGKFGRRVEISYFDAAYDPDETWANLKIEAR